MLKLRFSMVLAVGLVSCAAWAGDSPFVGTWKLNPSKSQLADQMKVDNVGGNKYAFDFGNGPETVVADGTDQPGHGGTILAVTIEGPDALKVIRKQDGRVLLTANWQLSKDGNTLSDDFTDFAPDGTASNSKYVYKRTTVTQGFAGTWVSTNVAVNYTFALKFQPYDGNGLSLISPYSDKPKNLSFDGKDYPNLSSNSSPGSAYAARRTSDRAMEITNKLNGKVVDTQQYMLSADLKTLTLTIYKTGEHTPSVWVFERQ